jgi:hypothetical protein
MSLPKSPAAQKIFSKRKEGKKEKEQLKWTESTHPQQRSFQDIKRPSRY